MEYVESDKYPVILPLNDNDAREWKTINLQLPRKVVGADHFVFILHPRERYRVKMKVSRENVPRKTLMSMHI